MATQSKSALYARIDPALLEQIDKDVSRRNASSRTRITRNDVVTMALERHVKEAARPRKKGEEE